MRLKQTRNRTVDRNRSEVFEEEKDPFAHVHWMP
jgi:hypothetical protein